MLQPITSDYVFVFITDTRFPFFISTTSNSLISLVFFNPPTNTLMALMYLYLALLCFGSILYIIDRHVETCREALAAAFESLWWLNFARFGHIQFYFILQYYDDERELVDFFRKRR